MSKIEQRTGNLVAHLLESEEPSIRLQVRLGVQNAEEGNVGDLREEIRGSSRVATLLSERQADGTIDAHPYAKWYGAHIGCWSCLPSWGIRPGTTRSFRYEIRCWAGSSPATTSRGSGRIHGLPRLHASIEGNALWAMLKLGLADERAALLAERLRGAQWPDGGWNCDRKASGRSSSFAESLIPLRALDLHARMFSDRHSAQAAASAAEFFLRHRLFRRIRDGSIIDPRFVQLHYPCYWHYDILFGLLVMAEVRQLNDQHCAEALDLLENKRLADGGFPAERRYYRPTRAMVPSQRSLVGWGGVSRRRMNRWVSARAAVLLHAAGRRLRSDPVVR